MAMKKITRRWFLNSFSIILLMLCTITVIAGFSVKSFYYSAARQFIESRAQVISAQVVKYASDSATDYTAAASALVQNFSEKSKMELMALDDEGNVTLTSGGFALTQKLTMPDFEEARTSENGVGYFQGMIDGEKVMAMTYLNPAGDDTLYAFRYMISMTKIDAQVLLIDTVIGVIAVCVLLLVIWSSSYFLNSIVTPVGEIGKTAQKIAGGDFESRLKKKNDDEIGSLCDAINNMAGELAATEKMKNDFISSVSHELRTPLTAIKGWSETITDSPGDTEITEKGMRVITSETDRLSQMVEELLDFSRMQSGRLTVTPEKMDVLAELGDAVLMFTQRARRENITLEYNEPETLPLIMGDKNRLKQVFVNIIDNAIKYSDSGDKVTVDAYCDGKNVCVCVADTGCGIKAEDLPKVKTKFYKANLTRRGSGIGLALADEIVRMHGGTLELDSEENVGTTVLIRLPIHPLL